MAEAIYYLAQADGTHEAVHTDAAPAETHAAQVSEEAFHGTAHAEGPMQQEPNLSVWTLVAFLIVVAGLHRLTPKLLELLDQRAAKIEGDLKSAEAAKADAETLKAQYQQQLADARNEARQIIDEARQRAEAEAREILARAQEDAAGLKQKAQEELEADKARAVKDLRSQIAEISCSVASRLVNETLTPDAHRALIDRFIDEVSAGNGSRN